MEKDEPMIECAISSDHAGYDLKEKIVSLREDNEWNLEDYGPTCAESVDYPDYVHPIASKVNDGNLPRAILVCGSGNGVAMAANKYPNVRAALCWSVEIARLAREHNDANILCIPARYVSTEVAIEMIDTFLRTDFEGGRHERRIQKIPIT